MDWRRLKNDETTMSRKEPLGVNCGRTRDLTCGVLRRQSRDLANPG